MTEEELKKVPFRETCHMAMEGEYTTTYMSKDGHKETFSPVDFLTFKHRKLVVQIDCYEEGEEITEKDK